LKESYVIVVKAIATMATDFRSGTAFPRRGREVYGGFYWLVRVFDKARASRNETIHDYIYPCPIDRAMFERWGITRETFDEALLTRTTDEAILIWANERISTEQREAANQYLLTERLANLDKEDAEEGVVAV
jgi:hypothetical protein